VLLAGLHERLGDHDEARRHRRRAFERGESLAEEVPPHARDEAEAVLEGLRARLPGREAPELHPVFQAAHLLCLFLFGLTGFFTVVLVWDLGIVGLLVESFGAPVFALLGLGASVYTAERAGREGWRAHLAPLAYGALTVAAWSAAAIW
jgi:hypothetical protein